MEIILRKIRVKNFRSLENTELDLNQINLLIGPNNSGKSNLLMAVEYALSPYKNANENDIYRKHGERFDRNKIAIIDLKFVPFENGKEVDSFDHFWLNVFTKNWVAIDETQKSFIGIRTIIRFDLIKNQYVTEKHPIKIWGSSIDNTKLNVKGRITSDMSSYINCFYMNALRDFSEEIKERRSFFGKTTSDARLSEKIKNDIENDLSEINKKIIESVESISDTEGVISEISPIIGSNTASVSIQPIAQSLEDLHKGMDVIINDENSASFSISNFGMGTKSWASFLSLKAYVNYINKKIKEEDSNDSFYNMLLLEEPEAHLHPQAQKQLFLQLEELQGQKIVSTHSSSIISQCDPMNIISVRKEKGETRFVKFNLLELNKLELNKIKREILRSKGELLFSNIVILGEGMTEETELPIYFNKYFGVDPTFYGINIIGVGGVNYGAFVKLLQHFNIPWYIFSDGEKKAIEQVCSAVEVKNIHECPNVVVLDNGDDIEKHLVRNGYEPQIIKAIETIDNEKKIEKTIKDIRKGKGEEKYQSDELAKERETGLSKKQYELYRVMTRKSNKTRYAENIALEIVNDKDKSELPPKILELFVKIEKRQNLSKKETSSAN